MDDLSVTYCVGISLTNVTGPAKSTHLTSASHPRYTLLKVLFGQIRSACEWCNGIGHGEYINSFKF
jgi:hypothetical protein